MRAAALWIFRVSFRLNHGASSFTVVESLGFSDQDRPGAMTALSRPDSLAISHVTTRRATTVIDSRTRRLKGLDTPLKGLDIPHLPTES
jgi:hypothetical protein